MYLVEVYMTQSTFSVRMDPALKKNFADICESIGMNMSVAINIFANAVVDKRKIPFEVSAPSNNRILFMETLQEMRKEAKNIKNRNMSLDDINDIIRKTRQEKIIKNA